MHKILLAVLVLSGWCCVATGALTPWFEVPITRGATSAGSQVITQSSTWVVIFQAITVLATVATAAVWVLLPGKRRMATAIAASGLVMLLLFPHCQMVWQPALTAHATWLQIQHENLTWFGGDIFRGQELEATPGQMEMYLSDSPRHLAVMKLPTWSLGAIGLHQLPNLLEWLGYTNTFCQFVSFGWLSAVAGLMLVLLTTIFDKQKISVKRLRTAVLTLLICGVGGLLIAWVSPFRASVILGRAADATHRGNHAAAFDRLVAAAHIWPPLREDTWYVAQMGLTESLLGHSSAHTRLHTARCLENAKQFDRAATAFRHLAATEAAGSPIRREACRGVLRHAIRALNSGETAKAVAEFQLVLDIEPCNLKALYALQVAHGQQGQIGRVASAHRQLSDIYVYLNFPNKKIVLGKSQALVERPFLFHAQANGEDAQPRIARSPE